jgi:hypothetical protein
MAAMFLRKRLGRNRSGAERNRHKQSLHPAYPSSNAALSARATVAKPVNRSFIGT